MGLGQIALGWDEVDEQSKNGGEVDYNSVAAKNDKLYRFRAAIPKPTGSKSMPNLVPPMPAKKRFVFLPAPIFTIWEHGIYNNDHAFKILRGFNTVCIPKSDGSWDGGPCPFCERQKELKTYAKFTALFGVIDMGQVQRKGPGEDNIILHHAKWSDSKGNEHERKFEQCLLPAPKGSEKNPGLLTLLKYKTQEIGLDSLYNTVWDATRLGEKSPITGDDWTFVKQLPDGGIQDYLVKFGANPDDLDLSLPVFLQKDPSKMKDEPGIFDFDLNDLYQKQCKALSIGNMQGPDLSNRASNVSGAGFGNGYGPAGDAPMPDDDYIPF